MRLRITSLHTRCTPSCTGLRYARDIASRAYVSCTIVPLSRAYAIPRDDPERGKIMEEALLRAVRPPMEVMGKCARALELIALYGEKGSALAISDAGCAAALALAAMKAAALNVKINTKSMADRDTALELNGEADRLLALYGRTAEKIYQNITGRLV